MNRNRILMSPSFHSSIIPSLSSFFCASLLVLASACSGGGGDDNNEDSDGGQVDSDASVVEPDAMIVQADCENIPALPATGTAVPWRSSEDFTFDSEGNELTPPIYEEGYFVNVRLVGEDGSTLEPFRVEPAHPQRVWA